MMNVMEPAALPAAQGPSPERLWNALEKHHGLRRLFLTLCVCFWGLLGGLLCVAVCKLMAMVPRWDWLLCAVGYPALLLGLWGGVIALYRNTDPEP